MTGTDNKKWGWLIVLGAAAVYLGAIWHRPLFAPDEIRYAQISREMLLSGSFAVPTLNGLLCSDAPAPAYWPAVFSMKLLGGTPFAVRLPAAVLTLLTAWAVYLLGMRGDDRKTGICAALLYLAGGPVFAAGTCAVPDTSLVFFLTAGAACGCFYATEEKTSLRLLSLFAAGLFFGAGTLVKGLAAPVSGALLFTVYFFWKKEFKKWAFALLPAAAGMLCAVLPAAFYLHRHAPDLWRELIGTGYFSGAVSGAGDALPFRYCLPVLAGGLLPVLSLAAAGFMSIRKRWKEFFFREDPGLLCTLAVLLWFVFSVCLRAGLRTTLLPLFPFAALLTARSLGGMVREGRTETADRLFRILCIVIGCAAAALTVWHLLPAVPWRLKLFSGRELVPAVTAAGLLLLWYSMAAGEKALYPQRKFLYFCLGTGAFMLSLHHIIPQKISRQFDQTTFIRRAVLPRMKPGSRVLADGRMAASAAWVLRRNTELYSGTGEPAPELKKAGGRTVTLEEVKKCLPSAVQKGQQIIIITNSRSRLRELPPYTGKTVTRSGNMAAVFYGDHVK